MENELRIYYDMLDADHKEFAKTKRQKKKELTREEYVKWLHEPEQVKKTEKIRINKEMKLHIKRLIKLINSKEE